MTRDLLDKNLAHYETPTSVREYTRDVGLNEVEAALVDEFFPKSPCRVLDLGCGAGRTTIGLRERGFTPVAIDLSEALLREARARYPDLDFKRMDATKLEFPASSFDAALFSYNGVDCIHPVEGRLACFREVFRILKPGGTFLLSTHNLIGAIFSGGFFYAWGYWNAAKMLARQVGNPVARGWYMRYDEGDGAQFLYSAPPSRTTRQLEEVGFSLLEVRGETGERRPRAVLFHQKHVHLVARKPA